jgi:hypothetical protein
LHQPENSSGPTDQWLSKLGGPCQNQVVLDQRTTANVEACVYESYDKRFNYHEKISQKFFDLKKSRNSSDSVVIFSQNSREVKLAQGQKLISMFLWMLTMNP